MPSTTSLPYTVLQVIPELEAGGAERAVVDVARAVRAAGGTALAASHGGPMVGEVVRAGAEHIAMPLASKLPWVVWANARRLEGLIRSRGVDLVHARSRAPAWSAWLACRRTGVPFVTTFHAPYRIGNPLKRRYNAVMAEGRRVIAISAYVAEHVVREYQVPRERIVAIPRGIDLARFDDAAVSADRMIALARRWGVPEDRRILLLPGRLTRWKGQTVFLKALARLERDDAFGLIVGSDQGRHAYRAELEALADSLGLAGRVTIADHCDDMPAAYKLAALVVHASTEPEGFGRTVIEAQAMGRPVIAAALGGPPETVRDGRTGWLVPPDDPVALAGTLGQALDLPPAGYAAMAAAAREHVSARFGVERMVAATIEVYRSVIAERRQAPARGAASADGGAPHVGQA